MKRFLQSTILLSSILSTALLAKTAIIDTNMGSITIDLNEKAAPTTVANFVQYANSGHYNGTVFHRVIPNFMIQGGGFDTQMQERETRSAIFNEAGNGLKNDKYSIAMARTSDVNSATSQFFINVAYNGFLNQRDKTAAGYGYAVFGKVTSGFDVVDKIATVYTKRSMVSEAQPIQNIIINKIIIRND
jgi:peptidyl-prolyl cis-trans isomerase B (cyclophilin B)